MGRDLRISITSAVCAAFLVLAAGADLQAQDLLGEYWENATIPATPGVPAGAATYTSNDAVIDYDDNTADATVPDYPVALASLDNFVCRWTGFVLGPTTGTVTFTTLTDDGVHLTVGGTVVINNWTDHGPTTDNGTFAMTAGVWYAVQLQFYEKGGGARTRLSWSYTGQADQIIPGANQAQTVPTPAAPMITSSSAGDLQSTFNTINWSFAGVASNFRIYRSTTNGVQGALLATVAGNVFTYTDPTANVYGTTYYYSVTAVNGIEGPASNPQAALTPQPPPPRTADHDEGAWNDNCACGSTVTGPLSAWGLGILGLALLGAWRRR